MSRLAVSDSLGAAMSLFAILSCGAVPSSAAAQSPADPPATENRTRSVVFELTYAHRDLLWLGDPASPTARAYLRSGARPIATDLHVRTSTERPGGLHRHYLREARLVARENQQQAVLAFTPEREKEIGVVDAQGKFRPHDLYHQRRDLFPSWPADPSVLAYDPQARALYYVLDLPGPVEEESLDFLPLALVDRQGQDAAGRFSIEVLAEDPATAASPPRIALLLHQADRRIVLAEAVLPDVLRRSEVQLGSYDATRGTYFPEAAYRPGAPAADKTSPSVTLSLPGKFTAAVDASGASLVLVELPADSLPAPGATPQPTTSPQPAGNSGATVITIDGNMDDWRNVPGVDDPRGDVAPYLEYVPDVDLLEFKVAHDEQHLFLYARVAGQVGRSHPDGGRSYFYAYIDVDQNPGTGFVPSRDDDCYFGVEIGDDCEVQFEFVNNVFRKTFYGFCGLGGDDEVLRQQVTLGKSQYGRLDERGVERAHYKSEYIFREGRTEITEDLKLGTSDTIRLAVSPDGQEVEVVSELRGFLQDPTGQATLRPGQTIDVAAGMECDSKAYLGKSRWGADSTRPIRGYRLVAPPR